MGIKMYVVNMIHDIKGKGNSKLHIFIETTEFTR